jgi:hypothetical protein
LVVATQVNADGLQPSNPGKFPTAKRRLRSLRQVTARFHPYLLATS